MDNNKVNLTIQIEKELRDSFKKVCKSQDTDVSKRFDLLYVSTSRNTDNKIYLRSENSYDNDT